MPDEPISRTSISCDILQRLHGFEHGSGRLLVEDERVEEAPVERGSDRQHLLGPGRDADRAGAVGTGSDGSSATRREFSGWSATVPSSRIRCARNSPRTPLSISSSRLGVGKRMQVVIARSGRQDRTDADQRDRGLARKIEHLLDDAISISMSRCSRLSAKSGACINRVRPPSRSASRDAR